MSGWRVRSGSKSGNSGNGGIEAVHEEGFDAGAENEVFLAGSEALPPIGVGLDHEVGVAIDDGLDASAQLVAMRGHIDGFESVGQVEKILRERGEHWSRCGVVADRGLDF